MTTMQLFPTTDNRQLRSWAKNASEAERVRENQRRSRARKREYVASLEDRLHRCHEAGVKVGTSNSQLLSVCVFTLDT